MPEFGPKVAALKDRLRQFIDLSARWQQSRATEGAAIRELRGTFGLTMGDAAGLLGISKSYLSLIESGRSGLPPEIAERAVALAERLERCEPERGRSLAEIAQAGLAKVMTYLAHQT
jgi:DNA-binding transcriptional regulator YiaG